MRVSKGVSYPVMRRDYIVVATAVCLFLIGAGLTGCAGPLSGLNIFTDKEEIALGKQFSQEIEKELTIYQDLVIAEYIDKLGQRLALYSRRKNIPYYFKVVDTEVVNAFALPGGYLYVNLGLIRATENESELAGVIGHEIGHVVGKHGAKQLTRQLGIAAVVQLMLGKDPNKMAEIVAGIVASGSMMKYSRNAEREADGYGVEELYNSGIDPEGLATFFEKLFEMQKREPTQLEQIFSTHPPTTERVANVRKQISQLPKKANLAKDSRRFQEIKRRLPPPKKQ